ncbi:MAG: hypothetical protein WC799_21490 [Desulfobacteraceae bacterium]|jgi:hypothetical protein
MTEKINLEIAASKLFCECYRHHTGINAEFIGLNKPPVPDATCKIGDYELHIEIAHLFGNNIDAQRILGRDRKDPFTEETLKRQRLIPLNIRIPKALNYILDNKSKKVYETEKVWLVIRNGFPIWIKDDFELFKSEIEIPKIHPFEKIWLICDGKGNSGLMEIKS